MAGIVKHGIIKNFNVNFNLTNYMNKMITITADSEFSFGEFVEGANRSDYFFDLMNRIHYDIAQIRKF